MCSVEARSVIAARYIFCQAKRFLFKCSFSDNIQLVPLVDKTHNAAGVPICSSLVINDSWQIVFLFEQTVLYKCYRNLQKACRNEINHDSPEM